MLWAELEGIIWDYDFGVTFDHVSYNTIKRVQEQMYTPQHVIEAMDQMSNEQRLEIINKYCTHCGGTNLPCHCANDE